MLVLLFASLLAVEPGKTFEVASVKPAAPSAVGPSFHVKTGARFGPGTSDATRWACDNCSLGVLLTEAYNLKRFQIAGPKWLDSERFDIVAQVAEGATKEDLRVMEQNLLAERFGLKVHMEKKEMQVYDLVVGKGSLKLKETAGAKPAGDGAAPHELGHGGGGGGFQHDAASGQTFTITMHGNTRHQAVGEDMRQLSDFLAAQLDRPVTDSTGLTGKYDFLLTFSGGKGPDMSPMGANRSRGAGRTGRGARRQSRRGGAAAAAKGDSGPAGSEAGREEGDRGDSDHRPYGAGPG